MNPLKSITALATISVGLLYSQGVETFYSEGFVTRTITTNRVYVGTLIKIAPQHDQQLFHHIRVTNWFFHARIGDRQFTNTSTSDGGGIVREEWVTLPDSRNITESWSPLLYSNYFKFTQRPCQP